MSERQYPSITIHSEVWDATWILNKMCRLTEKYNLRVNVRVTKAESIEYEIALVGLGLGLGVSAGFTSQIGQRFANDLYDYIKKRIKSARERNRKINIDTNDEWKRRGLPYG